MVELLKASISLSVAFSNVARELSENSDGLGGPPTTTEAEKRDRDRQLGLPSAQGWTTQLVVASLKRMSTDVFR